MNIISRIKSWFEPAQKPKVRVRFNRHGKISRVCYPESYSHGQQAVVRQQIASYEIQIGIVEPMFGLFGQADCFNRNMIRGALPLTDARLQLQAFKNSC